MKRPDCGNQRTGQPRCAQFTAKTWNCSPSIRRTQQAASAVFPSVGVTKGLRNVASRVSPSGNSLTRPSGTHAVYAFSRPSVTDESRKRTIGTASVAATAPLKKIPSFMNRPRRVINVSFDIVKLLALPFVRSQIRLSRCADAVRGEPAHHVGHFLIRHRPSSDVSTPVGSAQFGPTRNDGRSQPL